jgi:hypothetical protein
MKFTKLLKGCFTNTVFIPPHKVARKLPTMPPVIHNILLQDSRNSPLTIKGNQGKSYKSIVLQKLESMRNPNAP